MWQLIRTDQPELWHRALQGLPQGYWHTWEACNAIAAGSGLQILLFSHLGTNGSRAACVFAERKVGVEVDIYTPAGFSGFVCVGDVQDARRAWLDFVARQGYVCGYFALHPVVANEALHSSLETTNMLYVVDLSGGVATTLARSDRYVRRVGRAWQKSGEKVITERAALTRFIIDNYADFMSSVGANPAIIWSNRTLKSMLQDERVLIAGASDEQGICAAHTFAATPCVADAHLNISVRNGRQYITPLIIWGIEALVERQVPWLNLGGGVVPGDSVALAKEKFGPQKMPLRVAKEVYRPEIYKQLCAESEANLTETASFFPAYRSARRLPAS